MPSLHAFYSDSTYAHDTNLALPKPPTPPGGWSSIIGIVCALVGNVLISFALNTQRYAHIRLQKEADNEDIESDSGKKSADHGKKSYGATQADIADERSKKNAQAKAEPSPDGANGNVHSQDESSALIPSVRPSSSHGSTASRSTVHPHDEKSAEHHKPKNYLKSPYWWIGITLMVVGEAGNFLAYGFAPASIVSPLGVVALVSNCIIAPFMLKERFRLRDLVGVVFAVGGAVTVVLSAKGSNPKLGPHEIVELVKRWEFLLYLGITIAAILTLMVLSNRYGDRTIVIDIGLVGLFGGYTALSTKGVASLLSYRFLYVFTFPIAYVLVAVLVFTAVMQIKYLNRALQRFDSTQVIPTQFVTFTLFVVLGSAILYRDFEKTTAAKILQFIGGVALTFLGVWFITGGRTDKNEEHDGGKEDEEAPKIELVDEEAEEAARQAENETSKPRRTSSEPELTRTAIASASSESQESFATAASTAFTASTLRPDSPSNPTVQFRPPTSHTTSTPNIHTPAFSPPARHASLPGVPKTPPPRIHNHNHLNNNPSTRDLLRPSPSPRILSDMSLSPSTTSPRKTNYPQYQPDPTAAAYQQAQQLAAKGVLARHPSLVERVFSLPGPLTSPLSGGLSAVIANDLRRVGSVGPGGGGAAGGSKSRRGSAAAAAAVLGDGGSGSGSGSGRRRTSERGRRPSVLGARDNSRTRGDSVAVAEPLLDEAEEREHGGRQGEREERREGERK